jgi:hypothetical protein
MPTGDPRAVARGDGYVARLQQYVLEKNQQPAAADSSAKKKRGKKAGAKSGEELEK